MQVHDWIELLSASTVWLVPCLAVLGLWLARATDSDSLHRIAQGLFLGLFLIVAFGTMRTMALNHECWFAHCSSLGAMIVGSIFPFATSAKTAV